MAEAGQFPDLPSGQAGTGLDNVKASLGLGLAPTGFGDLHRAGMGSPRVGRPGDGRRGHALPHDRCNSMEARRFKRELVSLPSRIHITDKSR